MSSEIKLELVGKREFIQDENIWLKVSIPNKYLNEQTTRDLRFGIKNKVNKLRVVIVDSKVLPGSILRDAFKWKVRNDNILCKSIFYPSFFDGILSLSINIFWRHLLVLFPSKLSPKKPEITLLKLCSRVNMSPTALYLSQ